MRWEFRSGGRQGSSRSRRHGRRSSWPVCSESPSTDPLRSRSGSSSAGTPLCAEVANDTTYYEREGERMKRARWLWLAAVLVLALVGAGCGGGNEESSGGTGTSGGAKDKVTLQLKWVTQAQFAGYYAAKAQ